MQNAIKQHNGIESAGDILILQSDSKIQLHDHI